MSNHNAKDKIIRFRNFSFNIPILQILPHRLTILLMTFIVRGIRNLTITTSTFEGKYIIYGGRKLIFLNTVSFTSKVHYIYLIIQSNMTVRPYNGQCKTKFGTLFSTLVRQLNFQIHVNDYLSFTCPKRCSRMSVIDNQKWSKTSCLISELFIITKK